MIWDGPSQGQWYYVPQAKLKIHGDGVLFPGQRVSMTWRVNKKSQTVVWEGVVAGKTSKADKYISEEVDDASAAATSQWSTPATGVEPISSATPWRRWSLVTMRTHSPTKRSWKRRRCCVFSSRVTEKRQAASERQQHRPRNFTPRPRPPLPLLPTKTNRNKDLVGRVTTRNVPQNSRLSIPSCQRPTAAGAAASTSAMRWTRSNGKKSTTRLTSSAH